VRQHVKGQLARIQQRQENRRRVSGRLKTWKTSQYEPEGDGADFDSLTAPEVKIVQTADGKIDLAPTGDKPNKQVIRPSVSGVSRRLSS
jgi:hypothetical protein